MSPIIQNFDAANTLPLKIIYNCLAQRENAYLKIWAKEQLSPKFSNTREAAMKTVDSSKLKHASQ